MRQFVEKAEGSCWIISGRAPLPAEDPLQGHVHSRRPGGEGCVQDHRGIRQSRFVSTINILVVHKFFYMTGSVL
jgi:hypothetical protein